MPDDNVLIWEFGGAKPKTRADTLQAEGDKLMADANEFRFAEAHAKREAERLTILAITAWAKAEALRNS
jgi:hypothetical protein